MTDDGIRERHGMRCMKATDLSLTSITIYEGERYVTFDGPYYERSLTPYQARYLAAKLYRLSRRIRQRSEGTKP